MCLNEYHLILLLAGAFVGFSHSLSGVIYNMNYVSFHAVQVCDRKSLVYLSDSDAKNFCLNCSFTVIVHLNSTALCMFVFLEKWKYMNTAISFWMAVFILVLIFTSRYFFFQQYKYLRFKGSLPLLVKCSATQAVYSIRNYIVVYLFLGKWLLFINKTSET